MLRSRLIPILLIIGDGLYKTVCFKSPNYIGDPRNAVKIFNEKEVDEICILDITATIENRGPNISLIEELASEAFMPLSYGGGITNIDDIKKLFSLGVEKVIVNTALYSNPMLIKEAAKIYGEQSIIASVDVKKDIFSNIRLYSHCGRKRQKFEFLSHIKMIQELGVGEILLNNISRDGMMKGMDICLIQKTSSLVDVPLVAVGGIGSLEDIKNVINNTHVSAIGIGSFFVYHGKHRGVLITYPTQEEIKELSIK